MLVVRAAVVLLIAVVAALSKTLALWDIFLYGDLLLVGI